MDEITKRLIQKGSPFELQEVVINGIPCKIFPHGPKTIQDILLKARFFAQREFVLSGSTRLCFGQALDRAKHLAKELLWKYTLKKGTRVALLMDNGPEWTITFIAFSFIGLVTVIIHTDTDRQALANVLKVSNSHLIVTDPKNAVKLKTVCITCPVIILADKKNSEKFSNNTDEHGADQGIYFLNLAEKINIDQSGLLESISTPAPDDEAMILFTSGTTGDPKGIILTHRNVLTGLMNIMLGGYMMNARLPKKQASKQTDVSNMQPCSLLISPFSHISGFATILLMCYLGGKIVLISEWNTDHAAAIIEKEKVQSISGASPASIRELLWTDLSEEKLASLKNINVHGIALHQNFIKEIAEKFPFINIATGYGMTETSGSICNVSGTELLNNPDTGGPILPSVDIKIIDYNGKELTHNEPGEICIRGAMVMNGYCYGSDNEDIFLKDGWLRTGDLGFLDTDGCLYITDRIRDVLTCGNQKVSARELERSISEHFMIDKAVILGLPNSDNCVSIVLAVLPNKTMHVDEKELKNDLILKINKYSDRIKIIIVDSMPSTISGKVNMNELRRQIAGSWKQDS